MRFALPHMLWLMLLLVPVSWWVWHTRSRREAALGKMVDRRFFKLFFRDYSFFAAQVRGWLAVTAMALVILAAARPQWDTQPTNVTTEGLDMVICLDVSRSMDATDFQPSRLIRAKDQISRFLDKLSGDRVGLVIFSGRSEIACPLTDDYEAVKSFLQAADTHTIGELGTDIGRALHDGSVLLGKSGKSHLVLVVSDGEDLAGKGEATARSLSGEGMVVYTLGVGTPQGGKIPADGGEGYETDDQGQDIITKLEDKSLREIARAGGGEYYQVTSGQGELEDILNRISRMERERRGNRRVLLYKDQYRLFLGAALLLMILELLIIERRKKVPAYETLV